MLYKKGVTHLCTSAGLSLFLFSFVLGNVGILTLCRIKRKGNLHIEEYKKDFDASWYLAASPL